MGDMIMAEKVIVRPTDECLQDAGMERTTFQRYHRMIYNKKTSSIAVYGPFPVDKDYKMAAFTAILPAGVTLAGDERPSLRLLDLFNEFITEMKKIKKSKRRSRSLKEVNGVSDGRAEASSPEENKCASAISQTVEKNDDPSVNAAHVPDCVEVCVGTEPNLTLSKIELTITDCSADERKLAEGCIIETIEISSDEEEDMEVAHVDWDMDLIQVKSEPLVLDEEMFL